MAAFVGFAPAGPVNKPTLITNWSQYVGLFGQSNGNGRRDPPSRARTLSHAVYGYFLNGGGRCWITRVGTKVPTLAVPGRNPKVAAGAPGATGAISAFSLQAKDPGPGNIDVEVSAPAGEGAPEGSFVLRLRKGSIDEKYEGVTLGRSKGGVKNVAEAVQSGQLVMVLEQQSDAVPELGKYTLTSTDPTSLPVVQPGALKETPRREPASRGWRSPKTRR